MIEIKNLSKTYGSIKAIDDLSFSIKKGEVIGFLGPNGAGKTTTMKIITGYMAPSQGEVKVGGYDVFENPMEVKKKIGYLPEVPPVYLDMYVGDYLAYVAELKKVPKIEIAKKVQKAIEKTNLGDVQQRLIGNLSKGFRQRVGIAEAIVSEPEILILDEPTVGLDPKQVFEIRTLIQQLSNEHTVILSTHILPEVQATCQRIIIINKGKIVLQDTMQGLQGIMSSNSHMILKVKKEDSGFIDGLQKVTGVSHTQTVSPTHFLVDTKGDEDVNERILELVIKHHVGLLEFRPQDNNLEELFIKLTSEN